MNVRRPTGYQIGWAISAVVYETAQPVATRVVRYWDGAGTMAPMDGMTKVFLSKAEAVEKINAVSAEGDPICVDHTGRYHRTKHTPNVETGEFRARKVYFRLADTIDVQHASHGADWEHLGIRLAVCRDRLGLTQLQGAGRIGLHRTALVEMELGQRKVYALELKALAREYGNTDVTYLLRGLGESVG